MISKVLLYFFMTPSIWARSLRVTATRIATEASQIGYGLALLGLVIGGVYLALGKQDGGTKVTQEIIGLFVIVVAPSIVSFSKGFS